MAGPTKRGSAAGTNQEINAHTSDTRRRVVRPTALDVGPLKQAAKKTAGQIGGIVDDRQRIIARDRAAEAIRTAEIGDLKNQLPRPGLGITAGVQEYNRQIVKHGSRRLALDAQTNVSNFLQNQIFGERPEEFTPGFVGPLSPRRLPNVDTVAEGLAEIVGGFEDSIPAGFTGREEVLKSVQDVSDAGLSKFTEFKQRQQFATLEMNDRILLSETVSKVNDEVSMVAKATTSILAHNVTAEDTAAILERAEKSGASSLAAHYKSKFLNEDGTMHLVRARYLSYASDVMDSFLSGEEKQRRLDRAKDVFATQLYKAQIDRLNDQGTSVEDYVNGTAQLDKDLDSGVLFDNPNTLDAPFRQGSLNAARKKIGVHDQNITRHMTNALTNGLGSTIQDRQVAVWSGQEMGEELTWQGMRNWATSLGQLGEIVKDAYWSDGGNVKGIIEATIKMEEIDKDIAVGNWDAIAARENEVRRFGLQNMPTKYRAQFETWLDGSGSEEAGTKVIGVMEFARKSRDNAVTPNDVTQMVDVRLKNKLDITVAQDSSTALQRVRNAPPGGQTKAFNTGVDVIREGLDEAFSAKQSIANAAGFGVSEGTSAVSFLSPSLVDQVHGLANQVGSVENPDPRGSTLQFLMTVSAVHDSMQEYGGVPDNWLQTIGVNEPGLVLAATMVQEGGPDVIPVVSEVAMLSAFGKGIQSGSTIETRDREPFLVEEMSRDVVADAANLSIPGQTGTVLSEEGHRAASNMLALEAHGVDYDDFIDMLMDASRGAFARNIMGTDSSQLERFADVFKRSAGDVMKNVNIQLDALPRAGSISGNSESRQAYVRPKTILNEVQSVKLHKDMDIRTAMRSVYSGDFLLDEQIVDHSTVPGGVGGIKDVRPVLVDGTYQFKYATLAGYEIPLRYRGTEEVITLDPVWFSSVSGNREPLLGASPARRRRIVSGVGLSKAQYMNMDASDRIELLSK